MNKISEEKYLGYLNKTCEETKEAKEKLQKRLIYYKKGTLNYNMIIEDISKFNLSICNVSEKYSKRYNSYIHKIDNIGDENNTEDNNEKNK